MNENDTDWSPSGYRALAAAILKGGFEGVVRPRSKRVQQERISEWLYLWSSQAELFAECLNFPLEAMRQQAWEKGLTRCKGPKSYQTPPFCSYPELAPYAPYFLEKRLRAARLAAREATEAER